tara:strand:+ start:402 stop:830 length:429 start_codon:yes stop_codon:yes gene_type:complete
LILWPLAAQLEANESMGQEEIVKVASPDLISDGVIRYIQDEDMYQGTVSWQSNKASTKFNNDIKKGKKIDDTIRIFSSHCICPVFLLPKLGGNRILGYGLIFAAIPIGLKFASVASLNPIAVFFIYLAVFWIVYFFIYIRNR